MAFLDINKKKKLFWIHFTGYKAADVDSLVCFEPCGRINSIYTWLMEFSFIWLLLGNVFTQFAPIVLHNVIVDL